MTCDACPFSHSDAAENGINLGCLPDEYEIMQIHRDTGKKWTCHEDGNKLCAGFVANCREHGIPLDKTGPLANYEKYYHTGIA